MVNYFFVVLLCLYFIERFAGPSNTNTSRRIIHLVVLVTAEETTMTTLLPCHLHRHHGRTQETDHDQEKGRTTVSGGTHREGPRH